MARDGYKDLARQLAALGHPIRIQVLQECRASQKACSPSELAITLGASLGVVSYHVRLLSSAGLLHLVTTQARRGAIEHYYRMTPKGRKLLGILDTLG